MNNNDCSQKYPPTNRDNDSGDSIDIQPQSNRNVSNLLYVKRHYYNFPTVMLNNITGALSNKIPEIYEIARSNSAEIICITESWCNSNIPDECIAIPGFNLYRRDRQDGRNGGGVVCYISESLPTCKVWHELDKNDLETIWITMRPKSLPRGISHISMCLAYHPPKSDDWEMSQHLIQCADQIKQKYPQSEFIITGDFNHMKDSYLKRSCQLKQLVKYPTHGASIIDLFYSSANMFYCMPLHLPGVGLTKHQTLIFKPNDSSSKKPKQLTVQKRKQTIVNRNNLKDAISNLSWTSLFKAETCQDKFELFSDTVDSLIDTYLPYHSVKSNNNDQPWITDKFRYLIKRRQFYFHSGNDIMFKMFRNKVNRERKRLKQQHVSKTLDNLKQENPKKWWKSIKSLTGQTTKNDSLFSLAQQQQCEDMSQLATQINMSFHKVSSHLPPLNHRTQNETCHVPDRYIISIEEVRKQLSKINISKAPGPDGIPSWILKDLCHELAPAVCSIFNASFRDGFMPQLWKSANTRALPKVSPPKLIDKDLRPISLTPILSKNIEFYARNWFMDHFKHHLDDTQYGSQKNCSTVLALSHLVHLWLVASESTSSAIRVLLLDFSKAFDLVDHTILLEKVAKIGAPEFLINWLHSFLQGRQQRVKIGDKMSPWVNMQGGVPQGTLLGPVTFLLHINDLKTECNSIKYVDDTTIWESCDPTTKNTNIQRAANQAITWCTENNMKINTSKTKEMLIYFGKKDTSFPPIEMNDEKLERVSNTKLLGVILNNKLTWGDHVDYICSKVTKRLYFLRLLKRAKISGNDIIHVYNSIIRSVMEYACEVWHPGLTKYQTQKLELIQKRAIRIAYPNISYEDALGTYTISTLHDRREHLCKEFFLKICKPEHKLHQLLPTKCKVKHLRHARTYNLPRVKTNRLKNSPVYYGVFNFQNSIGT